MISVSQLNEELKTAMLAKDELKTSVLRMLKTEVIKKEKEAGKEVTPEEVQDLVKRLVKQRKDSMEQFRSGGREDLAEKEAAEINILSVYLPEQLSEEKIREIVKATSEELGVTDKSGMGRLMGALMPKFQGQADGAVVKKVVEEILS